MKAGIHERGWRPGRAAIAVCLAAGAVLTARAADWQITQLASRGTVASSPQTAVSLEVSSAGDGRWQARPLTMSGALKDGDRIRVPGHVELRVTSAEGVHVRHDYGSDAELELKLSAPGRNAFAVLAGEWLFRVEKRLDTVSVVAGRGQALSRNTAFAIGVDPQTRAASFRVTEGVIDVWVEREVRIAGQATAAARTPERRAVKAGDPALVLVDTAEAYLFTVGSFNEAVQVFETREREAQARGDIDGRFNALVALGDVLRAAGRGAEALVRFDEALALAQGPGDAYWRAVLQGRRGDALTARRRFSDAALAYRRAIDLHASLVSREGEDAVTDQRGNLAGLYAVDGTFRCAEAQAKAVLEALDARAATRFHPTRAQMWGVQGDVAVQTNRIVEALTAYDRAVDQWRILGFPSANQQPDRMIATEPLSSSLVALGLAQIAGRQLTVADATLHEARAIAERLFAGPSLLQFDARLAQAEAMAARGRHAAALSEIDAALAALDPAAPDPLRLGDALQARGLQLLALGRTADAVDALSKARATWQQIWPQDDHPRFAQLAPTLARALRVRRAAGDEAQAQGVLDAAREGARQLAQREQACLR